MTYRDTRGHWRVAATDTHSKVCPEGVAASPAPSILIPVLEVCNGDTAGGCNFSAAIVFFSCVYSTIAHSVWLWLDVWKFTTRATDRLTLHKVITICLRVRLHKVGQTDSAFGSECTTYVSTYDSSRLACTVRVTSW